LSNPLPIREYASAGGVVVRDSGERVLVLLRHGRSGPDAHPEIRLPKGHIEPGENPQQAALREVYEEAGLSNLEILADLGHQTVEFNWQGHHYIRHESYFLMHTPSDIHYSDPEEQFVRLWLTWEESLARLSFEAEREWVRRARRRWSDQLQDIPNQHSQETKDHSEVEKQVAVGEEE
jgi:8-oxo-dGTP pyrophosphatase MutT (NUDIX family)